MARGPRAPTPVSIWAALVLLPFAFAAPFLGAVIQDRMTQGAALILGPFAEFAAAGLLAGVAGIVCTIVGAWRGPRSLPTLAAMALAGLLCLTVAWLVTLLRR